MVILEDNQSCLKFIEQERLSDRSKHIDKKFYFVRDNINKSLVAGIYYHENRNDSCLVKQYLL